MSEAQDKIGGAGMRRRSGMKRATDLRHGSDNERGSRFTGNDVHEFIVTLIIAAIIIGLMVKITFF
jgi:hypothetical protein